MAIITSALLTALHSSCRMDVQRGQSRAVPMWDRVATEIQSSSERNTYGWLGRFPNLREWVGDRVIDDMKAHAYEITNKTYEATVGVLRDDIEDDNLGTYAPMMEEMGYGASVQVDQEVFGLMKIAETVTCYDGQSFFDTDHPVYANHDGTGDVTTVSNDDDGSSGTPGPAWSLLCTKRPLKPFIDRNRRAPEFVTKVDPRESDHVFMKNEVLRGVDRRFNVGCGLWQVACKSKAPLDSTTFAAAYQAMMEFKADGGQALGVVPDLLVVPPALKSAATATVEVPLTTGGASNTTYGWAETITVPWLA